MSAMSCKDGEFKTGARCYKPCTKDHFSQGWSMPYENNGELCTNWQCVLEPFANTGRAFVDGLAASLCGAGKLGCELGQDEDCEQEMDKCVRKMQDTCGGEFGSCSPVVQCITFQLERENGDKYIDPCAAAVAAGAHLMTQFISIENPLTWLTMPQTIECLAENSKKCAE
eukprot:Pgem_evm1s5319